jgi:hypothetical protein
MRSELQDVRATLNDSRQRRAQAERDLDELLAEVDRMKARATGGGDVLSASRSCEQPPTLNSKACPDP